MMAWSQHFQQAVGAAKFPEHSAEVRVIAAQHDFAVAECGLSPFAGQTESEDDSILSSRIPGSGRA